MNSLSSEPPSDPPIMPRPSQETSILWGAGSTRRVTHGGLAGFAAGAAYATIRALPPSSILRAGMTCGALAAPFFALRELVALQAAVDGPVASAVAGGFAGYVGGLFVAGPHWKTVSHSAMVVGIGCGVVDFVVSGLNVKRKAMIVERQDAAAARAKNAANAKDEIVGVVRDDERSVDGRSLSSSWWRWSGGFPVLRDMDEEYYELLRRQKATVMALDEEQARIAILLEALENIKAGTSTCSVEEDGCSSNNSSRDEEGVFTREEVVGNSRRTSV